MSLSLNGFSQLLHLNATPDVVTYPLTMMTWFKPVDHSFVGVPACITSGADHHIIQVRGTVNNCGAASYATSWALATTTSDFSDGTWQHLCGVFTNATDRAVFLDGGSKGTNSDNQTPVGINDFTIGNTYTGGTSWFYGKLAHVAIWDIALSDAEVAQLAAGANPVAIQSAHLIAYYPLLEDASDAQGGATLTPVGSPTYDSEDNPTVDEVAPDSVSIAGATAIYEGYTLSLTAVPVGGSGNYTYQWNKEGSPISGATSVTYTKENATTDDAGHYTCTVTNGGGSTTSSIATVTVTSATVAFVVCGQRSAAGKNVWAYNEAGVLLWDYDTAGSTLYGALFDAAGRVVVWGVAADNGDGDGTRTIWRLDQSGAYIDGANVGSTVQCLSIYDGIVMTVGGGNDAYWLDETDLSVLDQDALTGSSAAACLRTTDGKSWYGYQVNVSGPDYFHIRELDVNLDEVFDAYVQTGDSYTICALAENSAGKVIAWLEREAIVVQHTTGGGGGFLGDWDTTIPGWGSLTTYQSSLFVDQNDSNKIYCIGDGFGVLNSSGTVLYNKDHPSKAHLIGVGSWGEAGKALVLTNKEDGGNVYLWLEDTEEFQCVADLEGPDDEDYLYGLVVASSVSWNFAAAEELDVHDTDNQADSISATAWVAQCFTLTDYKKPGRVTLHISRYYNTNTTTVSIQAVDGEGKPDGVDICTGTFTAVNAGADSVRYMSHVFFTTTPILNPGTYALVVRSSASTPIGVDSGGGHSGDFWDSTDGGSSWAAGSYSLTFDLWGDESGYVLPSFDSQSGNQNLYVDQTPTPLSVTVSGTPTPTLQWYADGSPISGATSSTYAPPAQSEAVSISYVCRATNVLGYTDSTPMVITWSEVPPPADPTRYNILNMQLDLGTRV